MENRIIDKIKMCVDEKSAVYSNDELIKLGIDPNLFVFFSRPDFSDNAFALWEYIDKNTNYKTAWLIRDNEHCEKLTLKGIENAFFNSPEGQALARKARFFINTINSNSLYKPTGQIFVNLWHGTGVKATDFLIYNHDAPYLLELIKSVSNTDLFLVHSFIDKSNMTAEFHADARKFIATGQPRFDRIKVANGKNNINRLYNGILSKYDKIILYAPTYKIQTIGKGGIFFSSNVFNLPNYSKEKLNDFLEKFNAALVVKLHPIDRNKFTNEDLQLGKHGYILSDDDLFYADLQMNDVLNAFDVMIGDYSSIITDFMVLNRPIVYAIGDFDEYSNSKGFMHNDVSFYMPGEKATNFDELLAALEDAFVNPNRHSEWRKAVYRQKSTFMDDNACKRALEAIENYKPLTDYSEKYYIEKVMIPYAEEYEKKLDEQDERLWDYETRISLAMDALKSSDLSAEKILSILSTPSVSRSELKKQAVISALEILCDNLLASYSGEYVFFSPLQRWNWDGKTRTALMQLANQFANMGYLFLFGKTKDIPFGVPAYPPVVSDYPSADRKTDKLVILDYCYHTKVLLSRIQKHGKKTIFIVPSDFLDIDDKIMELGCSLAYRTVYLNRYRVKDYLGMKSYSEIDIARWEAYKYACNNDNIVFIACNDELYNFAKEYAGQKEIFLQTPGVDCAMFSKSNNSPNIPEKLKEIKATGKPIIGYCGTIDGRLYFSMIHYICGARPDYQFVFVGANRIKNAWGHVFESYSNIHLIEEVEYELVPDVIGAFDVAMIPYFKSAFGRIPSKLFEYFACGKPVVTTNMAMAEKYEHIFSGESHGDFVNRLDEALREKDNPIIKSWAVKIAEENDWRRKASQIINWIGL
jgi:CDP-glycerol glycerophosphotransferase (TagB/SpsB family)/glycosyltransferase involved in cell wall biosynthesis